MGAPRQCNFPESIREAEPFVGSHGIPHAIGAVRVECQKHFLRSLLQPSLSSVTHRCDEFDQAMASHLSGTTWRLRHPAWRAFCMRFVWSFCCGASPPAQRRRWRLRSAIHAPKHLHHLAVALSSPHKGAWFRQQAESDFFPPVYGLVHPHRRQASRVTSGPHHPCSMQS